GHRHHQPAPPQDDGHRLLRDADLGGAPRAGRREAAPAAGGRPHPRRRKAVLICHAKSASSPQVWARGVLTKSGVCAILFTETGAAGQTVVPPIGHRSNRTSWKLWRLLLLFLSDLYKQAKKANDQNANLDEIGISNHKPSPPFMRSE